MTRNLSFIAALTIGAALFNVHAASAQTVVFDSITNATSSNYTASTPHYALGQVFNLTTTSVTLTSTTFILAAAAAISPTDVQVTQYFWGTASNTVSGTTAAYTNLLGSQTFDLGAQTFAAGSFYTFSRNYTSGISLTGATTPGVIGFSEVVLTNTGSGLVGNDNVLAAFGIYGTSTSNPSYAANIGSSEFNSGSNTEYYRNAAGESNGNFIGSDARSLGGEDIIAVKLTGTTASAPEPESVGLLLAVALPAAAAFIARRRRLAA